MQNYQSGGRTRSIVNIANVGGGGTAAFSLGSASGRPTLASQGFANHGTQKTLHLAVSKDTGNATLVVWIYHSFSGIWGRLQVIDVTDGTNSEVTITIVGDASSYHCLIPIEGAERIFIERTDANAGTATVYLGVNTI
jgi:hypothetical protein